MIKAIETSYKGYRFRSRLEARWAVFFDHLGLQWEYEPEGFELNGGVRYLPDFWLPELKTWVEVKPVQPSREERIKGLQLAVARSEFVSFAVGTPSTVCLNAYGPFAGRRDVRDVYDGEDCYGGWIMLAGPSVDKDGDPCDPRFWNAKCQKAVHAARSARFEFGESGAAR